MHREHIQTLVDAASARYELLIMDDPESYTEEELPQVKAEIHALDMALTEAVEDGYSR